MRAPFPSLSEKIEESLNDCPGLGPTYATYVGVICRAPTLSHDRINSLAAQFVFAILERQLPMASFLGFLMIHKPRPFYALAGNQA